MPPMRGLRIIIGVVVAAVMLVAAGGGRSHLPAFATETAAVHQHASHDHARQGCDAGACDEEPAADAACCPALSHGCSPLVVDCSGVALLTDAGVPGAVPAGAAAAARGLRPEAETPPPRG